MNCSISSDDPKAIEKLKLKFEKLEVERASLRKFNINARKNKTKVIPYKELEKLKNVSLWIKKRIAYLESVKYLDNNEFILNNVKVIVNYKENRLQFFFNEQPFYRTIKELYNKDFVFNKAKKCWEKELKRNNDEYFKILKL